MTLNVRNKDYIGNKRGLNKNYYKENQRIYYNYFSGNVDYFVIMNNYNLLKDVHNNTNCILTKINNLKVAFSNSRDSII